jgi:hypothetical protein
MSIRAPLLEKDDLAAIAAEFAIGKPSASSGMVRGRGNRRYVIDTPKGHFELRLKPMEEEFDLRREIDLLTFLEKHDFASPRVIVAGPFSSVTGSAWCCSRCRSATISTKTISR